MDSFEKYMDLCKQLDAIYEQALGFDQFRQAEFAKSAIMRLSGFLVKHHNNNERVLNGTCSLVKACDKITGLNDYDELK